MGRDKKDAPLASRLLEGIEQNGFFVLENAIPQALVTQLRHELEAAIQKEMTYHAGDSYQDYGMVLLCPGYGGAFLDLLASEPMMGLVEAVLGEHCIVYSYTSSSMPPNKGNYSVRIHNDCSVKMSEDLITRLGILISLNDFNEENGATWVLPGSHRLDQPPSEQSFFEHAIRLRMSAGSIWFAHPKIWHSGGLNSTNQWRHSVTIGFCKAYMKQRLDIPRILTRNNQHFAHPSEKVMQKLGFYAQVPASYEEYYAPLEARKFKQPAE